jgi:glycine oxidase
MALTTDVVVIGAGAIGGALAYALARRGLSVIVTDSGRIGRGATWASAGVLAPDWSGHDPQALTNLAADSLALWPAWAADLEVRSGVGLHLRKDGLLNLQADPEADNLPPELECSPPPLGAGRRIGAAEARSLEPILSGPIVGGVLDDEVYQVDNTRLAPALARAASDLGARFLEGTAALSLVRSGSRCTGVKLSDGRVVSAGAIVMAAGAWSGPLADSFGFRLPVEPWRGQMMAFDAVPLPVRRIVFCGELVLIPRPHGPLVVGTTMERAGFDSRVTMAGLAQILARARRIVPALGELPLIRTWAGLRPGTPDSLPYMGPIPTSEGLFASTGHGRKGIILAPLAGQLMARLLVESQLDDRLVPCLPSRIDGANTPIDLTAHPSKQPDM